MKNYTLSDLKKKLKDDFNDYVASIDEMIDLGTFVSTLTIQSLTTLKKECEGIQGCISIKEKIDRNISYAEQIKHLPQVLHKYDLIYRLSLASLVSGFELFMTNLVGTLLNEFPEKIIWPEKKSVGVNLELLKYYSNVGDLILKSLKGEPNFQDWGSTLRFLKENLKVEVDAVITLEEEEKIIFYQALRHVIVHNSAKIDSDFLRQIRNTSYYIEFEKRIDGKVDIKEEDFKDAKNIFTKIVDTIIKNIR
jgi:hypothetical protein